MLVCLCLSAKSCAVIISQRKNKTKTQGGIMFKSFIITAALVVSASAQASNSIGMFLFQKQIVQIQGVIKAQGLNWHVGDTNSYKLNMGGFINGTMKMSIREIGADGIWMVQDVDMMIQKSKIEVLLDPNTGEVKKMLVDGKEQAPPKNDTEIVDQKEATVTVPAGTFKAIYLKMKDKSQNDAISEMWVNPRDLPLTGLAKSLADSQLGKVTIELTSFEKK